jgi:hypothetical protein
MEACLPACCIVNPICHSMMVTHCTMGQPIFNRLLTAPFHCFMTRLLLKALG